MMVSEADRIKAVERVRHALASNPGDSPSKFKRKRGAWRALDRGDAKIQAMVDHELALLHLLNGMVLDMFTANACFGPGQVFETILGLSETVK